MPRKAALAVVLTATAAAFMVGCSESKNNIAPDGGTATPSAVETTEEPSARATTLGRDVIALVEAGDADAIWDRFDDRLKASVDRQQWVTTFGETFGEFGALGARVSERSERFLGFDAYHAAHRFENVEDVIELIVAFDDAERIAFTTFIPLHEAPTEYLDYETKTSLHLPFDDEWFVLWGGRTADLNSHVGNVDQRFAIDFVRLGDERSFEGSGLSNDDYFCFGEPVLAPAAGTIVVASDGLADNQIGSTNQAQPAGNHVLIDHGNGEYSLLAHFMQGSVAVAEGDEVTASETLGLCGNSGNSSEPHVHYHLQDGPALFQAEGLPAFFEGYIADAAPVERGEPLRGQLVSNAE